MDFIKLQRKLKNKAFYASDSEKVHLWIHILMSANWTEKEEVFGGVPIMCKAGQFTTGRKQLSEQTGISESKVERILNYFEKIEQQIEQQKSNRNRLITVLNWNEYQTSEQPIEQQLNNNRTHYKNNKNIKNNKNDKNIKNEEEDKSEIPISPPPKIVKLSIEEREKNFYNEIAEFTTKYEPEMLRAFFNYWSEKNKGGAKMRFELEKTFEISKRLTTWKNRQQNFTANGKSTTSNDPEWLKRQNANKDFASQIGNVLEKLTIGEQVTESDMLNITLD